MCTHAPTLRVPPRYSCMNQEGASRRPCSHHPFLLPPPDRRGWSNPHILSIIIPLYCLSMEGGDKATPPILPVDP